MSKAAFLTTDVSVTKPLAVYLPQRYTERARGVLLTEICDRILDLQDQLDEGYDILVTSREDCLEFNPFQVRIWDVTEPIKKIRVVLSYKKIEEWEPYFLSSYPPPFMETKRKTPCVAREFTLDDFLFSMLMSHHVIEDILKKGGTISSVILSEDNPPSGTPPIHLLPPPGKK